VDAGGPGGGDGPVFDDAEEAQADPGLGPDDLKSLRGTPHLIPACVIAIDRFFKAMRRKRLLEDSGAARMEKVGHNDSCPCGSGRKFEKWFGTY